MINATCCNVFATAVRLLRMRTIKLHSLLPILQITWVYKIWQAMWWRFVKASTIFRAINLTLAKVLCEIRLAWIAPMIRMIRWVEKKGPSAEGPSCAMTTIVADIELLGEWPILSCLRPTILDLGV